MRCDKLKIERQGQGYSLLLVILTFLLVSSVVHAGEGKLIKGQVIKVIDGDSFILKSKGKKYEIRMWGIDCPEYTQPYSSHAGSVSRKLIEKKRVSVEVKYYDKYDRGVGMVYLNDLNINRELVQRGSAWVYHRYCREAVCSEWEMLESEARDEKRGLWRRKNPIPPWEWRRKN